MATFLVVYSNNPILCLNIIESLTGLIIYSYESIYNIYENDIQTIPAETDMII